MNVCEFEPSQGFERSRVLQAAGSPGSMCQVARSRLQVQWVGRSVVRSILITLIKVLPSLVFFTPFLTNYAGISCFRFCFCSFSLLFVVVFIVFVGVAVVLDPGQAFKRS